MTIQTDGHFFFSGTSSDRLTVYSLFLFLYQNSNTHTCTSCGKGSQQDALPRHSLGLLLLVLAGGIRCRIRAFRAVSGIGRLATFIRVSRLGRCIGFGRLGCSIRIRGFRSLSRLHSYDEDFKSILISLLSACYRQIWHCCNRILMG